ncbi:unnamed protein product [Rotaria magnacalcarata]|uniref:HAT C-terminal dimerisation domain-containing protein n=1 Tax=Rotaria magnacalcarata TaxID=392030 RepID=A0A816YLI9_9BILA|nr:unnamed protein product [Rotaria magnacalcarata]
MDIIKVSSSNPVSVQKYSTTSLESFLKQKGEPKEYKIINNDQKHLSSPAWTKFGFPAKRVGDDAYQRIDVFASCFNCKSTYSYQSDGSGSQKYRGPIDIDDVLVSATTTSTNVAKLAHDYRSLIKPILIRQAECGALTVCRDLWTDNYQKINYLGLTIYFVDSDYKLYSFDLCCSRFNEVDKTGASVLQALRKQLDLFGLLPYMNNHNITFTTDRGSNILKALKGYPVVYCFAHRINNVLKLAFYQTAQKKEKKNLIVTTTPSKNKLKQVEYTNDTSSDDSSSEDDVPTSSPSKYIEANTTMSNLSTKAKEVLITIATSKKLVKYAKITGLNKVIQERGCVALKQECIVRWLSMSNMLESIDTSIEHIRACLSSKNNYSFKLNNIIQTGSRPTLHMAYISMNKLANHLNGTDVNNDGDIIQIFDRHDGNTESNNIKSSVIALTSGSCCPTSYVSAVDVCYVLLKNLAHLYIREQLNDILGLNQQKAINDEPVKTKHKSTEDQFADPDDDITNKDAMTTPTVQSKTDELERYLRMNIEDVYKNPNLLNLWRDHQKKFPGLSLLARRLYSIPVSSADVERQFSFAGLTISQ